MVSPPFKQHDTVIVLIYINMPRLFINAIAPSIDSFFQVLDLDHLLAIAVTCEFNASQKCIQNLCKKLAMVVKHIVPFLHMVSFVKDVKRYSLCYHTIMNVLHSNRNLKTVFAFYNRLAFLDQSVLNFFIHCLFIQS